MPFYLWSQTAANNASADPTIGWAEGQAPSSINDSARAMMAATAKYRDDISGKLITAGTSTAYTLASNQVFNNNSNMTNQEISFIVHATNGDSPTLNVDGLGALPINSASGVALPAGSMIANSVYTVLSLGTVWLLKSFYGNPYNIPLAGMMDFIGSSVPNSSFVFPIGQAISRTTYATLFSLVGTTYGIGDGSTTFNVPDLTGRITAMKEGSATRLTSTYFGGNSTVLGAVGGLESSTLVTGNLPPYTPAGNNAGGQALFTFTTNNFQLGSSSGVNGIIQNSGFATLFTQPSFTGAAQGGTSTPVRTVPPILIVNKILRII